MEYPQFGLNGRVALVTERREVWDGNFGGLGKCGADVALGLRDVRAGTRD
jgi:hypothetical protein